MRYLGWGLVIGGVAAGGKQDALDGSIYDYVVVGGGTSGLVVANRLTEDRQSKYCTSKTPLRASSLTPQLPSWSLKGATLTTSPRPSCRGMPTVWTRAS
jgi:hypothetical protein